MTSPGKYARPEIERRWLVDLARVPGWEQLPKRHIEDLYLRGTFLRLRKVTTPGAGVQYKLGRKERVDGSAHPWTTTIYLQAAEHEALAGLDGHRVHKTRYALEGGALDVTEPPSGHAVFEREFETEAQAAAYDPPAFAGEEVTAHGTLAQLIAGSPQEGASAGARRHRIGAGVLAQRDGRLLMVHCVRPGAYDFWVAPGGGAQDLEDLEATARREAREECGLDVRIGRLAYVEEFHSPVTRYCKLWFTGEAETGTPDVGGVHAASEWVVEARFLARGEMAGMQVFPAVLEGPYWGDAAAGFPTTRYLGLREMAFW